MTWHAKETVRSVYGLDDPTAAGQFVDELIGNHGRHRQAARRLGRTVLDLAVCHATINNLDAGQPNWDFLGAITPR